MAQTYKLTFGRRLTNSILTTLLHLGVKLQGTYLLSVPGRKSGKIHTIPIRLIEKDGQRWLVAPYGPVNWVLNARAAGQVTLSPGRTTETVSIVELDPKESAPVLKQYLQQVSIVKPYFDVTLESPLTAFEAEAPRHPVFRIISPTPKNLNSSQSHEM
ncbi:MAG: nitroreductase/quinone reductase family protein [Ktedonobacteraceae bacterium]